MQKKFFTFSSTFACALLIALAAVPLAQPRAAIAASLSVWWPTEGAHMQGTQPFKGLLDGAPLGSYQMYWQVDGGNLNAMNDSYADYPHKEASVNLSGWNWRGSGPYAITFVAKQNGNTVAQKTVHIYVDGAATAGTTSIAPKPAPAPAPAPVTSSFYVDPGSNAAKQAQAWAGSRPADAAKMRVLADAPTAKWFGEWSGDVGKAVSEYVKQTNGKTAVMVAYNIPQRDCGGFSAGGTTNYRSWITSLANGIGSANAIVVLEPDALAQLTCLSANDQATRLSLLSDAVSALKKNPNTKVYVDAGHAGWVDSNAMADRLKRANVASADGFSLNVSNYGASDGETAYGTKVSDALGGKHFVIDTSRNGNGSNGEWCNAQGRAIGALPTAQTGNGRVDSFLWVKTPGESDGNCNGGPSAGAWWPEYALGLVQNAR